MPAPLEPDRLRRVGTDPVLVPRELPGDGHGELARGAGERHDARLRLAEALRDAADGAPVGTAVEQIGGRDEGDLALREPAQDGLLVRERLLLRRPGEAE